jgi:hypothetical protein
MNTTGRRMIMKTVTEFRALWVSRVELDEPEETLCLSPSDPVASRVPSSDESRESEYPYSIAYALGVASLGAGEPPEEAKSASGKCRNSFRCRDAVRPILVLR